MYAYFLLVVIFELGLFKGWITPEVYNSSPPAYISFFIFYYGFQQNSFRKTIYAIGLLAVAFCVYIFYGNGVKSYSIEAGVSASIAYVLFTLLWFISQLTNVDEISLLKKQAFWVSTSMLIWSVFFLFRLIPMYWLNINDIQFLTQINIAYQVLTIVCYCMLFRALLCKY
ncbi:hypothetical protein NAT51_02840 [Flavobacterium amniphilum]|uniref:hypothetical protein n=1 Tax=Flavobacterium amniphilum TaxID=1834035 RepID=UPI002029FD08|nr:hypothetical protein [Flavobacterium amniphilum]MCL9804441.1 hypothetical protein [Flavobacterium amniphilum]